ncbi:MAG: carboxymuconolactone decarboxylase family protein [Cyclobacteriaceae bacterium]
MERITYQDIPAGMFEDLRVIENKIEGSTLDRSLVELLRLRVSQINRCAYCVDMHHKELKHLGETDLRLSSLCVWEETPFFSAKEKAALMLAQKLATLPIDEIDEELFIELSSHFNKEEICFLTLSIAQIGTWNGLMRTFQFIPGRYTVQEEATA